MPFNIDQARSPGLPRRLAALLYDLLIWMGILLLAVTIVVVPLGMMGINTPGSHWAFQLYLLLVILGFQSYFWIMGQTIGMRTWRIRMIREDGESLTPLDALKRFALVMITCAPAGLGLWWVLFDRDNLAPYDRLSHTRPVMLKKP